MTEQAEASANRASDPSTRRRRYEFFGPGLVERVCFFFLPRLLFLSYLGLTAMGLAQMSSQMSGKKNLAPDFVLPWAASSLALNGHPQDVYVQDKQWAAEKAAQNPDVGYTYWSYPPTYLVVALPMALIPYRWSLLIWLTATLTAYCLVIWAIVPDPDALWIALAFPGTALNALAGQNGFLTTALLGAGLLLLRRKPIRAGVMFGLLTFKPQLGLLVPLALIATRRWRAIAAAAVTAIAFAAASLMMFGVRTWAAFLHDLPESSRQLNIGQMGWGKIQSVYGGLRLLGLGSGPAYLVQVIVALACATIAVIIWRAHRVSFDIKAAVLVTATLLVTPYVVDYDFVVLALPIAWMARDGAQNGFLPWEKPILLMTWLLPIFARWLALTASIPLAPLVIAILLACIVRRAVFLSREGHAEN
jgi:alpha-1,2-mannosyltransferase